MCGRSGREKLSHLSLQITSRGYRGSAAYLICRGSVKIVSRVRAEHVSAGVLLGAEIILKLGTYAYTSIAQSHVQVLEVASGAALTQRGTEVRDAATYFLKAAANLVGPRASVKMSMHATSRLNMSRGIVLSGCGIQDGIVNFIVNGRVGVSAMRR